MVQPFSVPLNIPKGTAVADGYRIAPSFSTLGATGVNAQGLLISGSSYKNYGPGMLITPLNTWNITPYATANGNIVANTAVVGAGWLTLAGDNAATTLTPSSNSRIFPPGAPNNFYLQLDWPRVPEIQIVDGNLTGPVNVTFFGFDWYGKPLQHSYAIQNIGRYPASIYNVAGLNGKAFYRITGVYFNGATPDGSTINCQVSNTFGLPYVLKDYNAISEFRWNNDDMLNQGGIGRLAAGGSGVFNTPVVQALIVARAITLDGGNNAQSWSPQISYSPLTIGGTQGTLFLGDVNGTTQAAMGNFQISSTNGGDLSVISWSIPNGGKYIIAPANTSAPSNSTGDIRGLFQLPGLQNSSTAATETWEKVPDGSTKAVFTYYCQGFDEWLSILNAGGQPQQNGVPVPGSNNIVPPNLVTDMYGLEQYYTGIPA